MDLFSILYVALLASGIIAADAAVNANTLTSRIVVSEAVKRAGLPDDVATQIFTERMAEIFATKSLLRPANARASTSKTFVTHLAHAARLEEVQAAFQDLVGLDPIHVTGVLMEEGGRLSFSAYCAGRAMRCEVKLDRMADETPMELLRRAALSVAMQMDPYHAAIALLDPNDGPPDPKLAREVLERRLEVLPKLPLSEPRALVLNLLGIVDLFDDRKREAARRFQEAIHLAPDQLAAQLNLAFARIEFDDYDGAAALAQQILARPRLDKHVAAAAHVIAGVADWARRRYPEAEAQFRQATVILPTSTDAYLYWADMLNELGLDVDAEQKRLIGRQNEATFDNYAEFALLYFWLNKDDKQPLKLRKSGLVPN